MVEMAIILGLIPCLTDPKICTQSVYLNTQSTNIAVIHTWEKLGFKVGRVSHVLTLDLEQDA